MLRSVRQRLPTIAAVLALVCGAAAVVIVTVTFTQGPTAADYLAEINEKCDGVSERLDTELTVDRSFGDRASYVDTMEQRNRALRQLHDEVSGMAVPDDAERPDSWLDQLVKATGTMAKMILLERRVLSGGGQSDVVLALQANTYVDDVGAAGEAAAEHGLDSCADTTSWLGPYTDS